MKNIIDKLAKIASIGILATSLKLGYAKDDGNSKTVCPVHEHNITIENKIKTGDVNVIINLDEYLKQKSPAKVETVYVDTNKVINTDTTSKTPVIPSTPVASTPATDTNTIVSSDTVTAHTMTGLPLLYDQFERGLTTILQNINSDSTNVACVVLGYDNKLYSGEAFSATLGGNVKILSEKDKNAAYQFNPEFKIFGQVIGLGVGTVGTIVDGKDAGSAVYLTGRFGVGAGKDIAAGIEGKIGSTIDPKIVYGVNGWVYCNLNDNWRVLIEGNKENFNDYLKGNEGNFSLAVLSGKGKAQYGLTAGVTTEIDMEALRNAEKTPVSDLYTKTIAYAGPRVRICPKIDEILDAYLNLGMEFTGDNTAKKSLIRGGLRYKF